MKKINFIFEGLFLLILLSFLTLSVGADNVKKEENLLEKASSRFSLTTSHRLDIEQISYIDGEEVDKARLEVYVSENGEKQLVTFIAPERLTDQKILVVGHNTWMYQDGLRRPIRISASQKLFGDAGIAETVGIDYFNEYQIEDKKMQDSVYFLELKAIEGSLAYQRAEMEITKEGYIKTVILMDSGGTELRKLIYQNYRKVNDFEVPKIIIKDLFNNNQETELIYKEIQQIDLPDRLFQYNRMEDIELILNQL